MINRLNSLLQFHSDDPTDSFVLYSLAQEYAKRGNVVESRKFYSILRETNNDYVGLYYHLGKLEESDKNHKEAIKVYDEGIAVAERLGDLHAKSELLGAKSLLEMQLDD